MVDLLFVVILVAFFALSRLRPHRERIVGKEEGRSARVRLASTRQTPMSTPSPSTEEVRHENSYDNLTA